MLLGRKVPGVRRSWKRLELEWSEPGRTIGPMGHVNAGLPYTGAGAALGELRKDERRQVELRRRHRWALDSNG